MSLNIFFSDSENERNKFDNICIGFPANWTGVMRIRHIQWKVKFQALNWAFLSNDMNYEILLYCFAQGIICCLYVKSIFKKCVNSLQASVLNFLVYRYELYRLVNVGPLLSRTRTYLYAARRHACVELKQMFSISSPPTCLPFLRSDYLLFYV